MKLLDTICLLLLTGLVSTEAKAQLKNSKVFQKWAGGLCDETIILDSTGYFFKERGCEGRSIISFGKYRVSKSNVVTFYSLPIDSLQPIRDIKRSGTSEDSTITITLYDRYDKPLTYAIYLEAIHKSGRHDDVSTDEKGSLVLNRTLYKDLLVVPLILIYGEQPSLVVGEESNIEVRFSLPRLFLAYSEIKIEKSDKPQMLLKQDGLYKRDGKTKIYTLEN